MIAFHKAIATVFGLGFAPKGPGTFGTLGAFLFMALFYFLDIPISWITLSLIVLFSFAIGTWSTHVLITHWNESDPQRVVIDEWVGYLITLFLVPLNWQNLILAFVLFRFFDITKWFGIRWFDYNVKGAWGVMIDDVVAGIYACGFLHIILYFIG